ncbi:MAG: hypothetical protein IJF37_02680 [Lachnospiraceae bacterium]|nr:hypothetical protein [Lachnospiraceae bacterium]
MYNIKKYFRNIPIGILMIIGFSILMFMLFNTVSILKAMDVKVNDRNRYNQDINIYIETPNKENEINIKELIIGKGNIYINNESAYIKEINMETVVYGLVQYEEELKFELSSGKYPALEIDDSQPVVVVGYDIYKEACVKGKDRYITILGVEYKIVGVLQKEVADNIDYTVIAFAESLNERDYNEYIRKSSDNYSNYYCCYQSDNYDYREDIEDLINEFKSKEIDIYLLEERIDPSVHAVNDAIDGFRENTIYLVVLCCLFNCFAITNLWIINRYIELSIRKAYGYNLFQILNLLIKDLFKYLIVSILFGFLMQVIYNAVKGANLINEAVLEDVAKVFVMGIIVVFVTVALQVSKVIRIAPASSMKEVL